jgi:hypothetical protein
MENNEFQDLVLNLLTQINKRFLVIDKRFDSLENQVKENRRILKALEHVAEVNKSEHDRMFGEIRDIKGNIVTLVDESFKDYLGRKTFRLIAVNE